MRPYLLPSLYLFRSYDFYSLLYNYLLQLVNELSDSLQSTTHSYQCQFLLLQNLATSVLLIVNHCRCDKLGYDPIFSLMGHLSVN